MYQSKKDEWDKFCHPSHSQIEDDSKEEDDTATTILEVTKSNGLGNMAKDVMDNISISDPTRAFNMLQTIIQEDNVAPSQTSGNKQFNSFLGFQNCINRCPQFFGEALNLPNIAIPKMWVLLDNQSTLHIFYKPDHPWISNFRSGTAVINMHCNSGIDNTNTISYVDGLYRDTLWIHPSVVTNILSFSTI